MKVHKKQPRKWWQKKLRELREEYRQAIEQWKEGRERDSRT